MRAALLIALVVMTFPSSRHGAPSMRTTLSGVVRDSSGQPLGDVALQFTDASAGLLASARSTSNGAYSVAVDAGVIVVHARRLGFAPYQSAPLTIHDEPVRHDIVLQAAAQTLGGVVVRAPSNATAFAARAAAGIPHAYFIDSAQLATKDHRSVPVLFDQLSTFGIHVGRPRGARGAGATMLLGPGACPAMVYLDGWHIDSTRIVSMVRASEIRGVEVYTAPASVPVPYRPVPPPQCAVVLIWTEAGFDWEPRRW